MNQLFGTDGVRGTANEYPMTPEVALRLGKAAAIVLGNDKKHPRILIGKDPRLSSYMIEYALTAGTLAAGGEVLLVGPMPTPAVAHLTKSFAADAGVVITASHNPARDNGIKFFSNQGIKLADETEERIEQVYFSETDPTGHVRGRDIGKAYRIDDAQGRYIEFAKSAIHNNSLAGLTVVVDCANGAAYKITPTLLKELGAEVIVLNDKPNGLNINLNCGALNLGGTQKMVRKKHADIGIALDGDADRVMMVDEMGQLVDGDQLMAIVALDMLQKGELRRSTLVATHYSNLGLDHTVKAAGGEVVRVENGDRYVIDRLLSDDYNFGGEQSGHLIFSDYATTGDGTISALKILDIMKRTNRKLSELAAQMSKYPQVLINVQVREKREFERMPRFMQALDDARSELEDRGRMLIRYSGTEQLLRVMVEGRDREQVAQIANTLAARAREEIGA